MMLNKYVHFLKEIKMEIIIGLLILAVVGYFAFIKKNKVEQVVIAPYKVEAEPAPAVELVPVVESVVEAVVEAEPVVVKVAPVKKSHKSRAPKVVAPVIVEKPVAKKAAKPAKAVAAVKAPAKPKKSKK